MFDCHVHSNFSGDSKISADVACDIAIKMGLSGIIFTDHLDLDYPDNEIFSQIDFDKYSKKMDNLKYKYNQYIKVLKGIEVGLQPHVLADSEKVVTSYDFDFVIASTHIIDKMDPYYGDYYQGKTKQQAFFRYLEEILDCVTNYKNYDVVGHIGYIRRYCNYDDKSLKHTDYRDVLDCILKTVIEDDKGIEINSSGYRSNLQSPIPDYDIVKRYKELGGEIISIGSDAHFEEHIAHSFDIVRDNLLQLGFKYVTHFEQRTAVFDKL